MTDFNILTFNSRVWPGTILCRRGRATACACASANLSMDSHPIHIHGHHFEVTGTDGGWIPESARWPEVTTDVPVGATRDRIRRRQAR